MKNQKTINPKMRINVAYQVFENDELSDEDVKRLYKRSKELEVFIC